MRSRDQSQNGTLLLERKRVLKMAHLHGSYDQFAAVFFGLREGCEMLASLQVGLCSQFPVVTTFKTAGTYKKMAVAELRPHYICVACATNMAHVPPYIYIYIYTAPARICTPLIESRSPNTMNSRASSCWCVYVRFICVMSILHRFWS